MIKDHTSHIAIVGDGAGALICFAVLRQVGLPATAITIYGDRPHPLDNLARYASAIRQQRMRSESNGHLLARDFPGLALVEAWQQHSPWPLLMSLFDVYNPSLALLIAQSTRLARDSGFLQRKVTARISCIHRNDQPSSLFILYDAAGKVVGTTRHVILALGHSDLAWPDPITADRYQSCQVTHAYQPWSVVEGEHVVVVGSGMAAAHTWIAALNAGARVTALHRRPLQRQRLNAPRCAFTTAGITAYQQLSPDQRAIYLDHARRGTFPWRWRWEWQLRRAQQRQHFTTCLGTLETVQSCFNHTDQKTGLKLQLVDQNTIDADRLICATGFQSDALTHPLIQQLVYDYTLPTRNGMLQPANDFSLLPISQPENMCIVVGALARWALPVANTFVGIKYVARRIAPRLKRSI